LIVPNKDVINGTQFRVAELETHAQEQETASHAIVHAVEQKKNAWEMILKNVQTILPNQDAKNGVQLRIAELETPAQEQETVELIVVVNAK
jgi:hypothetical protein